MKEKSVKSSVKKWSQKGVKSGAGAAVRCQSVCGMRKDAVVSKDANVHIIIRRKSENGLQSAILLQGPKLAMIT